MAAERANGAIAAVALLADVVPGRVFAGRPRVAGSKAAAACRAESPAAFRPRALAAGAGLGAVAPLAAPLPSRAAAPMRAKAAQRRERRPTLFAKEAPVGRHRRRPCVTRAVAAGTDGAERRRSFRTWALARRLERLAIAPVAAPLSSVATFRAVRHEAGARAVRLLARWADKDRRRVGIDPNIGEELELAALSDKDFALEEGDGEAEREGGERERE